MSQWRCCWRLRSGWPKALDVDHERDIVYGYKDGMALVMDCYVPQKDRNRAGVMLVMSGGLFSHPNGSHRAGQSRSRHESAGSRLCRICCCSQQSTQVHDR